MEITVYPQAIIDVKTYDSHCLGLESTGAVPCESQLNETPMRLRALVHTQVCVTHCVPLHTALLGHMSILA
jgi:hypothetical protein